MVGIEWTEKGERTVVTPSIDGPSYRWAQRCIIVWSTAGELPVPTSLASGNASTCYSFNSNRVPHLRSVSSVRPISPPPLVFSPSSPRPPTSSAQTDQTAKLWSFSRVLFDARCAFFSPFLSFPSRWCSSTPNQIVSIYLIAYCVCNDNRSIIGVEEGRRGIEKKFGLFRIITIYYGDVKDIEHDLALEEGKKTMCRFLASFLNRFKRRCYLPVFFSAEPSPSLSRWMHRIQRQPAASYHASYYSTRARTSHEYIYIYTLTYTQLFACISHHLSVLLSLPGLRSRINWIVAS